MRISHIDVRAVDRTLITSLHGRLICFTLIWTSFYQHHCLSVWASSRPPNISVPTVSVPSELRLNSISIYSHTKR